MSSCAQSFLSCSIQLTINLSTFDYSTVKINLILMQQCPERAVFSWKHIYYWLNMSKIWFHFKIHKSNDTILQNVLNLNSIDKIWLGLQIFGYMIIDKVYCKMLSRNAFCFNIWFIIWSYWIIIFECLVHIFVKIYLL